MKTTEIEAKFLGIDVDGLKAQLKKLGAEDLGQDTFREEVWIDGPLEWLTHKRKFVRLRETKTGTRVTFKHFKEDTVDGTEEIEFTVSDPKLASLFLERVGLSFRRSQEKRIHTFELGEVTLGFDTWPGLDTYLELEGPSEATLKRLAKKLDLDWKKAVFENALKVIERTLNEPVSSYKFYTFDYRGM